MIVGPWFKVQLLLTSTLVDVGMIDARVESHLWRLEGVFYRKVDVDKESASSIRALCGTLELCCPLVNVVFLGLYGDAIYRLFGEVGELLADTFGGGHVCERMVSVDSWKVKVKRLEMGVG